MTELDGYQQLYALSAQVPDWRSDRGKQHRLSDVVFLIVVALIAGAQNCEDIWRFAVGHQDWLRRVLWLGGGIPHHDMYLRTLASGA